MRAGRHAGAFTVRALLGIGIALGALAFGGLFESVRSRQLTELVGGVAYAAESAKAPTVGDAAPDVQLGDQHGRAFALGDALKAREFVVIAFYPKAFSGG